MNRQTIQTFGEAFNGKTPSKDEQRSSGYPILKIRDIDEVGRFRGMFESFVDEDFYKKHAKKKLKSGDTIILNAAHNADYVGNKNAFISDELEGVIATGEWLIVRINGANSKYVNHYLRSPSGRKSLKNCVKGIHLYPKDVERISVPLPSEAEQIRIAHLLGTVEALITQRKKNLQQLDDLLKSVFLEIFGDPVRNEKGWEKKTAIDFAECIVPGRDKPKSFSGGTPWVTTGDLMHLGYTEKSRTGIGLSEYEIKEVRARVVPKSSVLMTCVGDLGVVSICNSDMVINQQLHAFQVSDEMSAEFFMYSLSFQKNYMYQNASQTTLPYMNKTVCNKTPMVCPPIKLQMKFSELVQKVFHIKTKHHQILVDLDALYGSLSQQAFKGELDLSRVVKDSKPGVT